MFYLPDPPDASDLTLVPPPLDPRLLSQRLPLAHAVLQLYAYLLHPEALQTLFQNHRGRSFEQLLSFSTFTQLIADALLVHHGSGRQSFQRAREQGQLPTSVEAVYGKLRRIPRSLSLGLLEETTASLRFLFPETVSAWKPPPCLQGLTPVILDGKTLKKVAKRLKATRQTQGKISGGKLLVALLPQSGLVLTFAADLDGETNEAKLVPDLLPLVHARTAGPVLWIADAQFGDPGQIGRFVAREGDHALVRWDGKTTFHADPARPAVSSRDARGRTVIQQWGWLGAKLHKQRRYVRRIELVRPGEKPIILLTDLLEEVAFPAEDLLEVYLARWGIERVFQQITEVFALDRLIGSTAEATIFQASFCFVLYNLIQVVRAWIAAGREAVASVEELSSEQIFYDVRLELSAWLALVKGGEPGTGPRRWREPELRRWLAKRLGSVWSERWRKASNKKRRPAPAPRKACYGAHNSVQRLRLQQKAPTDST